MKLLKEFKDFAVKQQVYLNKTLPMIENLSHY